MGILLSSNSLRSKTLKREQFRYLLIRRKTQGEWSGSVIRRLGLSPAHRISGFGEAPRLDAAYGIATA